VMRQMKSLGTLANWLLIVGGLNWGLVGVANTNVVTMILGDGSMLTTLVYVAVGASAVYVAANSLGKG